MAKILLQITKFKRLNYLGGTFFRRALYKNIRDFFQMLNEQKIVCPKTELETGTGMTF